ncbi:hypothetical protein [Alicyclobacillus fodiniaquatilis]|uniref:Uncharacterized protein n=1 Tax=Alicyclobacillus fodiniaquatilis TaxID=1661150 RepID=A0ABW4JK02_9BACL
MDTYTVIADFRDKETGKLVCKGSTIEADDERAKALQKAGVIGADPVSDDDTGDLEIKHLGGGVYLLPNGEKVKGKEAAIAALANIEAGDGDGAKTGDGTGQ